MYYNNVYPGFIVDINDPEKIGRCKVRVPSVHGNIEPKDYGTLPWAQYILNSPAGSNRSSFLLPKVGDLVWVMFQGGDKYYPVIIGSTYGKIKGESEIPLYEDDDYSKTDIIYSSGDGALIRKTENSFSMRFNNSFIEIDKEGNIEIYAEGSLKFNGLDINLD